MIKYAIALAIVLILAAFFAWAFLPARYLPGHRARHLGICLHLRRHVTSLKMSMTAAFTVSMSYRTFRAHGRLLASRWRRGAHGVVARSLLVLMVDGRSSTWRHA